VLACSTPQALRSSGLGILCCIVGFSFSAAIENKWVLLKLSVDDAVEFPAKEQPRECLLVVKMEGNGQKH
jgi:hypothetical protein